MSSYDEILNMLMEKYDEFVLDKFQNSFFQATRPERKYRMKYIVALSAELKQIESQNTFGILFGYVAIELLIDGDYNDLKQCYEEDLIFDDVKTNNLWSKFRSLCEEVYENRPDQPTRIFNA